MPRARGCWKRFLALVDDPPDLDEYIVALKSWGDWAKANMPDLFASSQCVAEVEGCVREAIEKMRAYREQYTEDAKSQTGDEKEYSLTMAGAFIQAACGIIDIAAEHNIDMSEPTTEPPKGQKLGGDCPVQRG